MHASFRCNQFSARWSFASPKAQRNGAVIRVSHDQKEYSYSSGTSVSGPRSLSSLRTTQMLPADVVDLCNSSRGMSLLILSGSRYRLRDPRCSTRGCCTCIVRKAGFRLPRFLNRARDPTHFTISNTSPPNLCLHDHRQSPSNKYQSSLSRISASES